jgi:ribose transport system permease protein
MEKIINSQKSKFNIFQIDFKIVTLIGIIIAIIVVFSILSPQFLSVNNIKNVFLNVSIIVIVGSAATLLLITGYFDLSVGSILAFCGILHAYLCKHGIPVNLSIVIATVCGGFFGIINGLMVSKIKITPVIATLATMYAARGFAFLLARYDGGAMISIGLPRSFSAFGRTLIGQIPLPIFIMVFVFLVFLFIEKKTVLGRYIYAIGVNNSAAKISGINVVGISMLLYIIVGILSGLCGAMQVSRIGVAIPNIMRGFEFDVIVAIILGGTSLKGGEGSVVGMIFGAVIIGLVGNGLNLLNVQSFYQTVFQGLVLITAVLIDLKVRQKIG